jgi:hypothetical protein
MKAISFLICGIAAGGLCLSAPATAASPADDVAEISNSACLARAAGELVFPHPAAPEFEATMAKLGLEAGIDRGSLDMLGPATALVSRAAMGHRKNGAGYVVLASDGAMPGCRVILLAEPSAGAMDAVAAALTRPGSGGWTAFPEMTEARGPVIKRVFLRRGSAGAPYLLNLVGMVAPVGKVQLYTTVAAIPLGVALPEGF